MWGGFLVENNHCKIFKLIKLCLFPTYFPSALVTHAGSSKASHRYCRFMIKTCNWTGSASTRGSSTGMESSECEKSYFYSCERGSRSAPVGCVPPTPLSGSIHDLEGVFLQTKKEAMTCCNTLFSMPCTGAWLTPHSSVAAHCTNSRWKQRENLGCSWSFDVRPSSPPPPLLRVQPGRVGRISF